MSEAGDWIFEFLSETFESPSWEVPIGMFVDDNCAIFDEVEENQFSHKEMHDAFKQLVESLLIQHLAEVGVSTDSFYQACERISKNGNEENTVGIEILEQLVACDDYLTFKAIMSRRNKELTLEALEAMRYEDYGQEGKAADLFVDETERFLQIAELEREQAELETAIALSLATVSDDDKAQAESSRNSESKHSESKVDDHGGISEAAKHRYASEHVKGSGNVDDLELARREKYLQEQRAKILARKQAERAKTLENMQEGKSAQGPKASSSVVAGKEASSPKNSSRDSMLTNALARRMKQDLIMGNLTPEGGMSYDNMQASRTANMRQVENLQQEKRSIMRG